MTIVEKNIRAWVDDLGLKEQYMEEGIKEGIKEGKKTEKIVIARKMLKKGVPIEDIMDFTGLSREEILKLRDNGESV